MKPSDIKKYIHSTLDGKDGDDPFDFKEYVSMVDSYFFGNFLKDSGKFSVVKNTDIPMPFRYLDEDDGRVIIEYNPSRMSVRYVHTTLILEDLDMQLVQLVCELYVEEIKVAQARKKSKSRKKSLRVTKKSIDCLYRILFEDEYLLLELGGDVGEKSEAELGAKSEAELGAKSEERWSVMPSPSQTAKDTNVVSSFDMNDSGSGDDGDKIDISALVAQKIKQLTDIHFRGDRILKKKF